MMGRPLSSMERAIWLLDQAVPQNGTITAHVRHEAPLPQSLVEEALLGLQRRHPLLRARVTVDDRGAARNFELLEPGAAPIPLRVLPRADDAAWRAALETDLNARFDPTGAPLLRATLVAGQRESELVLSYHHLIGDALSGVYLHEQLWRELGARLRGERIIALPPFPLRPALGELLGSAHAGPAAVADYGRNFVFRLLETRLLLRPRKLALDVYAPPGERRMAVEQRVLDRASTARLVARARAQRTTVHGALCAAMLQAAVADEGGDGPLDLGCFHGVNLREQLRPETGPPMDRELGLYISQVTTYHRVRRGADPWALARECKRALAETMDDGEQFLTLPMLGLLVPRGSQPLPRFVARADLAAAAVGVTNLGRLDVDAGAPPLRLEMIYPAVTPGAVSPAVTVCASFDGRLAINYVFAIPLLERARAARLIDTAIALLDAPPRPPDD